MRAWWNARRERRTMAGLLETFRSSLVPGEWRLQGPLAWQPPEAAGEADGYQEQLRAALLPEGGRPFRMLFSDGGDRAACDTVIARGDWTLLVERSRTRVLRFTREPERAERLLENARWLSRSFRCPQVEPLTDVPAGWSGVAESFVSGEPIREAPQDAWEPAFRELLSMCRTHVQWCEGAFDATPVQQELEQWRLPRWLSRAVERHATGWQALLDGCPLLRGHADCHNGNVFVLPDGSVCLIDLERAQSLPFFFDALSLLRGSAPVNQFLRQAYLAGRFDEPLRHLWMEAGRTWAPENREAALMAMALAHAFRPQFAQASSNKRRDKFIGACEKLRSDCGWE